MLLKEKIKTIRQNKWYILGSVAVFVLYAALQYLVIELSVLNRWEIRLLPAGALLVGFATVLAVNLAVLVLTGRPGVSLIVTAVLTTALSLVNYYVNILHGVPFTFLLLKNTATALNVLSAYHLEITRLVVKLLLLCLAQIAGALVIYGGMKWSRKWTVIPGALFAVLFCGCYLGESPVIPKDVVTWSWSEAIHQYGYTTTLTQATLRSMHDTLKPEGYDEAALRQRASDYQPEAREGNTPDIFLILNETFFDLNQITDVQADRDYMPVIRGLEDALTGYAVVPGNGGGTNKSEYELLTGNSLQIAPNITPFNSFDMTDANSVVTLLKGLGYTTLGAHSEPSDNYNRAVSYANMGFDFRYFQKEFPELDRYRERRFASDASVYDAVLGWYEQMGEGPRFSYTLTIQNHGAYDSLTDDGLLVHTLGDFGENTSDVSEFLTCIYLSDQAFGELVDYFRQSDREVIVCMVGDHAPFFARDITSLSPEDTELYIRSTPYVIWSNYMDLSQAEIPERMSLPFLMPTVLDLAGVSMPGYFDYMLKLRDRVPVVSAYGSYMLADGTVGKYTDLREDPWGILTYLGLDYANINQKPFMEDFTRAG